MDTHAFESGLARTNAIEMIRKHIASAISKQDISTIENILNTIANTEKVSKASASILLKNTLDILEQEGMAKKDTISLYDKMIDWAEKKKRNLLKLDFKMRKAEALLALKEYKACLSLITETAKILKQADDKIGLVKLYYIESKVYYELKNLAHAKSSLTLAKSTSTFVYCPSFLQAKIDILNGIYLADEKDYKTATSYILEALEGFSITQNTEMIIQCARYLVLVKIMESKTREISSLLSHKLISPYKTDKCIELLCSIAECVEEKNLSKCNEILHRDINLISDDNFISNHLLCLCDSLLDENILKIIQPYSNVNIEYVGNLLGFDVPTIENRIRRMILDGRIEGDIDQETMCINIKKAHKPCCEQKKEISKILHVFSQVTNSIAAAK